MGIIFPLIKSLMEVPLHTKLITLFPIILLLWIGCEDNTADMVIQNGKIYTVDEFNPLVEAVAVKDGKIIAIGSQRNISQWIGAQTQVINLNRETMIPGLIEGHGHFMGLGFAKMRLDLTTISNYDELVDMVASAVEKSEPGEWILGRPPSLGHRACIRGGGAGGGGPVGGQGVSDDGAAGRGDRPASRGGGDTPTIASRGPG